MESNHLRAALQAAALPVSYSGFVLERVVGDDPTASSMAPRRSATELYPRKEMVPRAGLEPAQHEAGVLQTLGLSGAQPRDQMLVAAAALRVQAAILRNGCECRGHSRASSVPTVRDAIFGGGLRVRTPVLAGPLGFRDRLPAAPAEPSVDHVDRIGCPGVTRTRGLRLRKPTLWSN
jgi:hypothetical protein